MNILLQSPCKNQDASALLITHFIKKSPEIRCQDLTISPTIINTTGYGSGTYKLEL